MRDRNVLVFRYVKSPQVVNTHGGPSVQWVSWGASTQTASFGPTKRPRVRRRERLAPARCWTRNGTELIETTRLGRSGKR